jgi:hypothetical protein
MQAQLDMPKYTFQTQKRHFEAIEQVHTLAQDCQGIYPAADVRREAQVIAGYSLSDRQWRRWVEKCCAGHDLEALGGFTFGSRLLLCTLALLLRPGKGERLKVRVTGLQLAEAAMRVISSSWPCSEKMPLTISYGELKELVQLRTHRDYSDRYHRRMGLKASIPMYSRDEAIAILNRYPNLSERRNDKPTRKAA